MKQADLGLNLTTKRTRKRAFLDEMSRMVPWSALVELVASHAPVATTGRPPFALETVLCIHLMQQWFTLSDWAMEEALHDVPLLREFSGLDNWTTRLPDESTILRFHQLLEKHKLAAQILVIVNDLLRAKGLMLKAGAVVDALFAAPSSTKNAGGESDPEKHQSKKGNQWHFGMEAHIGVDAESGLVQAGRGNSGNVKDAVEANALRHAEETDAFGDAGYQGTAKRPDAKVDMNWHIAMRPGRRQALDLSSPLAAMIDKVEQIKVSIRAKVEHPFQVIKRRFGHVKVRYRGLKKNITQPNTLFALANLWIARKKLDILNRQPA